MNKCRVPYRYTPKLSVLDSLRRIYIRFYSQEVDVITNKADSLNLNQLITTINNNETVWVDIMLYDQYTNSHEIICNDCLSNGKNRIITISKLLSDAYKVLGIRHIKISPFIKMCADKPTRKY